MIEQLDLFLDDTDLQNEEIAKMKKELGNVRRGIFARHNELAKLYMKQQDEINLLKEILNVESKTKTEANLERKKPD